MKNEIENLLKNLSQKERDVIVLLFGLNGFKRTSEEIAALYGVEEDLILQVAEEALAKLSVSANELNAIIEKAKK